MQQIELPWPPSLNHYYRHVGNKVLISKEGREYRERICWILRDRHVEKMAGKLKLKIEFYPPDARRRDLDNVLKAMLDALQHGGLYADDSQIKKLHLEMLDAIPNGGMVVVTAAANN